MSKLGHCPQIVVPVPEQRKSFPLFIFHSYIVGLTPVQQSRTLLSCQPHSHLSHAPSVDFGLQMPQVPLAVNQSSQHRGGILSSSGPKPVQCPGPCACGGQAAPVHTSKVPHQQQGRKINDHLLVLVSN